MVLIYEEFTFVPCLNGAIGARHVVLIVDLSKRRTSPRAQNRRLLVAIAYSAEACPKRSELPTRFWLGNSGPKLRNMYPGRVTDSVSAAMAPQIGFAPKGGGQRPIS